jgi:hypothetical protein
MNGPPCFIIMPGTRPRSACFGYPYPVGAGELTGRARIVAANPSCAPFPAGKIVSLGIDILKELRVYRVRGGP